MDSKTKGEITEAIVLTELVKREIPVLTPFGENHRYDFVIEIKEQFYRLQCKTARHKGDTIRFQVNSVSPNNTGQKKEDYEGEIDYFIAHSRVEGKTYLVPIDVVGKNEKTLRLVPPKSNQSAGIDMAEDFELDKQLNGLYIRSEDSSTRSNSKIC